MFVDKVQIRVSAGDGGDGAVSFRHEKFVDKGGPDGGDGGDGGNIILVASNSEDSLTTFRFQKHLEAEPGKPGFKTRKHGRGGKDLLVAVPVGTVVSSIEGEALADLTTDKQQVIIARGGKGGFGNAHFVSSTRQAPRVAEKGEQGDELELSLELKMIADVGLVGLPNAGKSTLLSVISNARPEIANYPFTTLKPNLGVVDMDKKNSLLFADIPGLIEGASQGKGLGDEFLRHVERTLVLVHMIDAYQEDIATAYKTIQGELEAYKLDLSKRPQLVVINKVEGLDDELIKALMDELRPALPKRTQLFAISALSKSGLKELLFAIQKEVVKARKAQAKTVAEENSGLPVLTLDTKDSWKVVKADSGYIVSGRKIERFAQRTDFADFHATQRLRDIIKKMGIGYELRRQGIKAGDKVIISGNTLDY